MPKYWREFSRSGSKAKDGEKREKKRKRERLNDGNNNGQATHAARKHAWRTQAAWAKSSRQNQPDAVDETQLLEGCFRNVKSFF